jgi:hypothetical protein
LAIPPKVWLGPHRVGFTVRMTMAMEHGGFAGQLRRWRALRRMSQLDVATRADTTQQPAAIRLAARHLGGGTPTDQPGRSQREITIKEVRSFQ